MIRLADYKDTQIIIELLKQFLMETSYEQGQRAAENTEHLAKLTWTVQQYGYTWLAFQDEQPAGLLMALKEPNMWYPQAHELRELVWYVVPESRSTTIGGRLFLKYCEKAESLLKSGGISGYFTTRMTTTDPIDYESRGFRKTEETYLKE